MKSADVGRWSQDSETSGSNTSEYALSCACCLHRSCLERLIARDDDPRSQLFCWHCWHRLSSECQLLHTCAGARLHRACSGENRRRLDRGHCVCGGRAVPFRGNHDCESGTKASRPSWFLVPLLGVVFISQFTASARSPALLKACGEGAWHSLDARHLISPLPSSYIYKMTNF